MWNCETSVQLAFQELAGKVEAAKQAKLQEQAKRIRDRAPSKRLAMTLLKQGWQIGAPQVTIGDHSVHHC